jgi:hypothetical protein
VDPIHSEEREYVEDASSKDFAPIVERPAPSRGKPAFVSFCWDGRVRRIDENHFVAHKSNFVPTEDLTGLLPLGRQVVVIDPRPQGTK